MTYPLQPRGQHCLVIGSGSDLVGRRAAKKIDLWRGLVLRCNKMYGDPQDVGTRTDILVTRYMDWVARYFAGHPCPRMVVSLNEHVHFSEREHATAAVELGLEESMLPSCGMLAALWCLNRGAASVTVLGFGHSATGWAASKRYPDGQPDLNPRYNWAAEHRWLEANCRHFDS